MSLVHDVAPADRYSRAETTSAATPDWPAFGWADDVRPALAAARRAGSPAVLATLAAVEGGGPRPPGTQMSFSALGWSGFLSGGCVEGDLALHAQAVLADGGPRRLVYGRGSPFWDIRLLCGARIEVFLERLDPDSIAVGALLAAAEARRPSVWLTDGRATACLDPSDLAEAPGPFRAAAAARSGDLCGEMGGVLFRRFDPAWRLAVVGGDPIALAIAALGVQAGFETTLIRPAGPAAPPPVPGLRYSREQPGPALARLDLDPWTAVAVATHDFDADEAALTAALPSPAAYVGVLGSQRRLEERRARLRAAGVPEAALSRLIAPIGLPIGGKAPWEVAVSVVGQIIAQRVAGGASHA